MKEPIEDVMKDPIEPPESKPRAGRNAAALPLIALALLAAGTLALMLVRGRSAATRSSEDVAVGRQLATFEVEPLTGAEEPIRSADLRGRVVLVNFWGTWCPPCREEFPHFLQIYRQFHREERFLFISISCGRGSIRADGFEEDTRQLRRTTQAFLSASAAEFPTYSDKSGSTRWATQTAVEQQAFLYPTTMVLDDRGSIRAIWQGFTPGMELEIESLLHELLENDTQK